MPMLGSIAGGEDRPLGWWIKLVDLLLDESANAQVHDAGVTREHWQVLAVLLGGAASTAQVDDVLAPFGSRRGAGATVVYVDDLRRRGWVTGTDARPGDPHGGTLSVTLAGREAYDAARGLIGTTRESLLAGVAARDYEVTVATLQRVARNLGWDGRTRS